MKKAKIILDTDPGNDDLLAIIMALKSEVLNIQGLTIVGGNASIEHTTSNALSLLTYMNRIEVPVYVGDASALNEASTSVEEFEEFKSHRIEIHGETGLHVSLPKPSIGPQKAHAVDFIINEIEGNKGELILVPVGPLTNIALALKKQPRIKDWVKSIYLMGGAIDVAGNVTEHAEFNIYCDPEAAQTVMSSGINIKMCGLDITRRTSVKKDETCWLAGDSPGEKLIRRMLDTVFQTTGRNSFSLHDPITVLSVLHPEVIDWKEYDVSVICEGPQFGRTVGILNPNGLVSVGIGIDQGLAKSKIAEILSH